MLERWKQEAEFQGHPSVYFDAWKNDFTSDPLLAFISELEDGLTSYFKHAPISTQVKPAVLRALKKVWKPTAMILASALVKHGTGMSWESFSELFGYSENHKDDKDVEQDNLLKDAKEVSKQVAEAMKKALESHKTVKEAIKNFKENLANLITQLASESAIRLPILIFVDELDRCRPDYAIELLEGIKHLFGVSGVTFVIATNIPQLSESIKAVYGAGFDGQKYLLRFFDLQYTLSKPDNRSFCRLMLEEINDIESLTLIYGLESDSKIHPRDKGPYKKIDYLTCVVTAHANTFGLTLRDIAQLVTILDACFATLKRERIHIFFLVFLASIYQKNPIVFRKIHVVKNINEQPGLSDLYEIGSVSSMTIEQRDSLDRLMGNMDISMYNVASHYMRVLEIDDPYSARGDFPERNIEHFDYDKVGRKFVAKFGSYFSIVQQAGGFRMDS